MPERSNASVHHTAMPDTGTDDHHYAAATLNWAIHWAVASTASYHSGAISRSLRISHMQAHCLSLGRGLQSRRL